jgi:hypothetical protein
MAATAKREPIKPMVAVYMIFLIINPEDGRSISLRNVVKLLRAYMPSHHRRQWPPH